MANQNTRAGAMKKGNRLYALIALAAAIALCLTAAVCVSVRAKSEDVNMTADTSGFEDAGEWDGEPEGSGSFGEPMEEAVAAEYDGGSVLNTEVADAYAALVESGIAEGEQAALTVLRDAVSDRIESAKAAELGTDDLYAYVTKDVTVSEDEVSAAYDALRQSQSAMTQAEFEFTVNNGAAATVIPEDCRIVKDIFLPFDSSEDAARANELFDEIAALDPSNDYEQIMLLNDELRELYADLDTRSDAVIARLTAGEDFDSIMAEYPGSGTYYVSTETADLWSDEFVEGALYLEEPGQYTPISMRSPEGEHIILYAADAAKGEVPYEQVKDALTAQVLREKKDEVYEAQKDAWLEEAHAVYHPETLVG